MYTPPLAAVVVLGLFLTLPAPASAQGDQEDERERSGFRWRNRPSIQLGEHVRLDLRLKLQYDLRRFDPEIDEDERDFRVRRGGLNGEIGNHLEFQIEGDFNRDGRWRDVYAN